MKIRQMLSKLLEPRSRDLERYLRRLLVSVTGCLVLLFARIVCCKFLAQFQDQQPVCLYFCYSVIGVDVLVYLGLVFTSLYLIKLYKLFVEANSSLREF